MSDRSLPGATVLDAPGPWEHRAVSANGSRFHVVDAAAGRTDAPLVLCLHAFPENWYGFRHQLPALAEAGLHAVAMDLRGFGGSDKPPRGYRARMLIDDVHAVIRSLGHRDAVIVGSGVGGMIGWGVARRRPGAVRGLALVGVSALWPTPGAVSMRSISSLCRFQLPFLTRRRLVHGDLLPHLLAEWGGDARAAAPAWLEQSDLDLYRQAMALPAAASSARKYIRWPLQLVLAPGLDSWAPRVPLCQIHGRDDLLASAASVERAWQRPVRPGWHADRDLHLLSGAGHFVAEQAPEATTRALLDFITRVAP